MGEEILFENKSESSLLSLFVCAECGHQCFAEKHMLSMEELSGIDMGIPEESIDEEEQEERNKLLLEKLAQRKFLVVKF